MKITNLALLILVAVLLNLRVSLYGGLANVRSIVSCSTGWSLQWGQGFLGLYSIEGLNKLISSSIKDSDELTNQSFSRKPSKEITKAEDLIKEVCN